MCQASRRIYPRATLGCIRQPRTVSFRLWLNIPAAVVDLPRKTSLLFIFALLGGDTLIYSSRFADPDCRQAENTTMQTNQRRATYSWAMYDWANSAFATTVMAGFFPLFFKQYWSQGVEVTHSTYYLGVSNSVASLIIVILAPILGAMADTGGLRKRMLASFACLGGTRDRIFVPGGGRYVAVCHPALRDRSGWFFGREHFLRCFFGDRLSPRFPSSDLGFGICARLPWGWTVVPIERSDDPQTGPVRFSRCRRRCALVFRHRCNLVGRVFYPTIYGG